MSLNRTALRLATVLALTNGDAAPYPTIAGHRVFDSRLDPIAMTVADERMPIAVVTTDDDDGEAESTQNGGHPFHRTVSIMIETAVTTFMQDPDDPNGAPVLNTIHTDAEIEAMLDVFDHQIKAALFGTGRWQSVWRKASRKVRSYSSKRFADPTQARIKFAERIIRIDVEIYDDAMPQTLLLDAGQAVPPPALPAQVQAVVDAAATVPGNAYVAGIVGLLSEGVLPQPSIAVPLRRVRLIEATPVGLPRPDGVAEANLSN